MPQNEEGRKHKYLRDYYFIFICSGRKTHKNVNPGSAKAEYDLAAELGLATKSQVICRQRYASCPYTADEMMKALRSSQL